MVTEKLDALWLDGDTDNMEKSGSDMEKLVGFPLKFAIPSVLAAWPLFEFWIWVTQIDQNFDRKLLTKLDLNILGKLEIDKYR